MLAVQLGANVGKMMLYATGRILLTLFLRFGCYNIVGAYISCQRKEIRNELILGESGERGGTSL